MFRAPSNEQQKINTLQVRLKETLDKIKQQNPEEWNKWINFMCGATFTTQLETMLDAPPEVRLIGEMLDHPEVIFHNMTIPFKQHVINEIKNFLNNANELEQNAYVAPPVIR